MKNLKPIPYCKPIIITNKYFFENVNQKIFLEKTLNKSDNKNQK